MAELERKAVFFGGCSAPSAREKRLAYEAGAGFAALGLRLVHGGYNGLMEEAARGSAQHGGRIEAVSLEGNTWGDFNPFVAVSAHLPTMGLRLDYFFRQAEVVVAMGGGVGTLHEVAAALWHATNVRATPVWFVGATSLRLLDFLLAERWLYASPTRSLSFVQRVSTLTDLRRSLEGLRT